MKTNWLLEEGAIIGQETSFLWKPCKDERWQLVYCKPVGDARWTPTSGHIRFYNPQERYPTTKFTPISRTEAFLMIL